MDITLIAAIVAALAAAGVGVYAVKKGGKNKKK